MDEYLPIDVEMMGRALGLARLAGGMGEVPIGAVVYNHETGVVLAQAHNRREVDNDPLAHAEVLAIRAAARVLGDWRLEGLTRAVTLEPCPLCAGAIVNSRLGRVVFGASDPKAGACGTLMRLTEDARLNHRTTPIGGLMAEESAVLLRGFFARLRG
ncbi:MAG: nucleoside deaminase [bacterium]